MATSAPLLTNIQKYTLEVREPFSKQYWVNSIWLSTNRIMKQDLYLSPCTKN